MTLSRFAPFPEGLHYFLLAEQDGDLGQASYYYLRRKDRQIMVVWAINQREEDDLQLIRPRLKMRWMIG